MNFYLLMVINLKLGGKFKLKVLEELLENYWILNDQDNEKYEEIRQSIDDKTLSFIKQKLGYKLIINPYLIKGY